MLDQLLNDAIQKDLSFKLVLDEAELLIFSSTILPKDDDSKFLTLVTRTFDRIESSYNILQVKQCE